MTEITDTRPDDDANPLGVDDAFPTPPITPEPPTHSGGGRQNGHLREWRDPGTMLGAITAAVIGGVIAAMLYAWIAHAIHF